MSITSYHNSHCKAVLSLRDDTFAAMNLSAFVWQPCQQVESLDQNCNKFVFDDGHIKGYASAYQLDATHFRLNLIVDPSYTMLGIGSILLKRVEDEVVRVGGQYLQARLLEGVPTNMQFALAPRLHSGTFYARDVAPGR